MREKCGTPAYIAPEILKSKCEYSYNVDIWSAGVVLFAMLYGTHPSKIDILILKGRHVLKDNISQDARDMLRRLLEIDPDKRISIPEI
jgi:serine/threonine-protein kinase HSL1 (negative regulator of Swe1 kinase)